MAIPECSWTTRRALAASSVDPCRVGPPGLAVDDLGLLEEVEDEALVGGAALDHHGGLGHGATEPCQRFVAGASVGDDLGDHRVEVGGDGVALTDAGVDADARPRRQVEQCDPAGRWSEVAIRVLGVQPSLDGVPLLGRLGAFEPAAGRHVELRLDQVEVRRRLGDRVLDLEACVDLEEGERPVARVVEELDGRGADVAHGDRQPLGGRLELLGLARVQQRRRRLLDHLLVAPLHGAVADADRPGRAVAVGDQLDLDVPCPGDQALQEDHAAAERALGLVAGALVGVLELGAGVDPADAPATPTGRCLEHERVADALGSGQRVVQGVDAASAPRRDGHAHLLGEQLGADLVAQPAHRVGARTDEGHSEALAQVRERWVLRDEAPPDPDRVRPALDQHSLEDGQVDVGAGRGGTERVGLVGLPREHRRTFLVGVERDRTDRLPATLRVQVADGVDQSHRGLAAIHDRNSSKHPVALQPRRLACGTRRRDTVTSARLRASHIGSVSTTKISSSVFSGNNRPGFEMIHDHDGTAFRRRSSAVTWPTVTADRAPPAVRQQPKRDDIRLLADRCLLGDVQAAGPASVVRLGRVLGALQRGSQ